MIDVPKNYIFGSDYQKETKLCCDKCNRLFSDIVAFKQHVEDGKENNKNVNDKNMNDKNVNDLNKNVDDVHKKGIVRFKVLLIQ